MQSPWIDLGSAGLAIGDLTVAYTDIESAPVSSGLYTGGDGLAVEYADLLTREIVGGGPTTPAPTTLFRLTGIPDSVTAKRFAVWETATPAVAETFELGGVKPELDDVALQLSTLTALFQPAPGTWPTTFVLTDQDTLDPVPGVQVSIWDETLTVPVVPMVTTGSGGKVTVALPDGGYRAFFFRPYSTFPNVVMPYPVTVDGAPQEVPVVVNLRPPHLPTAPRITLFGWVFRPDLLPVSGAEVKLRLAVTPQIVAGGAGVSQFEMIAETDSTGRFEMYPVAGLDVFLTCDATGYKRRGRLPLSGSLNWTNFAKETL